MSAAWWRKRFSGGGGIDIFHQRGLWAPQKILMFHPDGCGLEGQRGAFPSAAITFGFTRKESHSFVNVSVIILAIISWKELQKDSRCCCKADIWKKNWSITDWCFLSRWLCITSNHSTSPTDNLRFQSFHSRFGLVNWKSRKTRGLWSKPQFWNNANSTDYEETNPCVFKVTTNVWRKSGFE